MQQFANVRAATGVGIAGTVIVADQVSKSLAAGADCGTFICPLANTELMLGAGTQSAAHPVLGTVALGAFVLYASRLTRRGRIGTWTAALVVGGIISNLIDRMRDGAVRDFLAGPVGTFLNLADLAIFVGLSITLTASLRDRLPRGAPNVLKGGEPQ